VTGMGVGLADGERAALLALLTARPPLPGRGVGRSSWSAIASEVALRGSARALWEELNPAPLPLALGGAAGTRGRGPRLDIAWNELRRWQDVGSDVALITVLDDRYPLALRGIHQLPPILFVKGTLPADECAVSIVGSRRPTPGGLAAAAQLAEALVARGVAVISGLAEGIDGAAHRATLAAGGRPIGVIGTGIHRVYPAGHGELHRQVAAAGALVSQFLPDAPPTRQSFPQRNITMSGLGRASIIVEAGEHSGTRVQARAAVEHGRPVILTERVVEATVWGRALVDRPGVHVAAGIAEILGVVEEIIAGPEEQVLEVTVPPVDPPGR
jgi:DNA processing protein